MTDEEVARAEKAIGHTFRDHDLLRKALTHASTVDSRLDSNERLEFLGDVVLGLVVCDHLYTAYPDLLEGEMTKVKSMVVSRTTCADVAETLGIADLLRLGKGMSNRAHLPRSVVAATLESVIGAIYLDGGLEPARAFVLRHVEDIIDRAAASGHQSNFKSVLQQTAQQLFAHAPQYVVTDQRGPDHAKCFEVSVDIGGRRFPACWANSKKQAEQDAALAALVELGVARREGAEVVLEEIDVVFARNRIEGEEREDASDEPSIVEFDQWYD